MIEVSMTRESVCMADDVDAPHTRRFALPDGADLVELAHAVARSSYLPMPSDAWGWTIEAHGAVVAVRGDVPTRCVETVRGDPTARPLSDDACLCAVYVRGAMHTPSS